MPTDASHPGLVPGRIGVFDSGYGGLTILREMQALLPQYDYLYLGDNARAPYGTRSFDIVYDFTRQAVEELFDRGCNLVILACNTASAKALRSIQQKLLPGKYPGRRVLGVIRPTVEAVGNVTGTRHIGLLATPGTVRSHSYRMELEKLHSGMAITETECPMWVPLIETGEAAGEGADYFVRKYIGNVLKEDPEIDTLVLGCTHYPLLMPKIMKAVPEGISVMAQGETVALSLKDYLARHPEMDALCTKGGSVKFLTTEISERFDALAGLFISNTVRSERITLNDKPDIRKNALSETNPTGQTEGKPIPANADADAYEQLRESVKKLAPEKAIRVITEFLEVHPDSEKALTLRGLKHWSSGHRGAAMTDYLAAIAINPDSDAANALAACREILDYRNKDLYNP